MIENNKYAVIMAGGVGSRFWPVSNKSFPKQFHDMLGTGKSLLQQTYSRLSNIVPERNIFILTNSLYHDLVQSQLPEITTRQIIAEPAMRNTAPCILLSALKIQKENPEASMIVAPSDHWIEDEDQFAAEVKLAFEAGEDNTGLMTLGVQPTFPNTGYGYIKYESEDSAPVKKVLKFTEKPNYQTAKSFLKEGNYLWNAGIFVWKVESIIKAFENYLPKMYLLFKGIYTDLNTENETKVLQQTYPKADNISIDYGILEKAQDVRVIPASFDWSDLGSWGALHEKLDGDAQNNVVVNAKAEFINASNNILRTQKGKIAILEGLNDFIVVEDENILLITPKSSEQNIKDIRQSIMNMYGENFG